MSGEMIPDDPIDLALDALEAAAEPSPGDAQDTLTEEARAVDRALAASALAALPEPPPASLRRHLLEAVSSSTLSLGLTDRLADLLDVPPERAAELLRSLPDWSTWDLLLPGVSMLPVESGPRLAGADVTFVRFERGAGMPRHGHGGEEHMFVLSGALEQPGGPTLREGDHLVMRKGAEHAVGAPSDTPCICAVVIVGGIDFAPQG